MKLISLNIWGGHVRQALLEFIGSHQDIDIFCLQEVYHNAPAKISTDEEPVFLNIFVELQAVLPNHFGYFRPVVNNIYGIGTFIKKDIHVVGEGEISIHEHPNYPGKGPTHSRNLQWLKCQVNDHIYAILNVHGLWNGQGKTDSPERIAQSQKIKTFMDSIRTPQNTLW
ncbi:MAG: hypothetical protein Q7V63_02125 [Gammaproteobacteria bacterium]|nr:hypothetical protein [Gammaproteobacteria bacterium]